MHRIATTEFIVIINIMYTHYKMYNRHLVTRKICISLEIVNCNYHFSSVYTCKMLILGKWLAYLGENHEELKHLITSWQSFPSMVMMLP